MLGSSVNDPLLNLNGSIEARPPFYYEYNIYTLASTFAIEPPLPRSYFGKIQIIADKMYDEDLR